MKDWSSQVTWKFSTTLNICILSWSGERWKLL
jgi:hypothetical protein